MGGSAFTRLPYLLATPRIPPAVYHKVKSACHARLRKLYIYVDSPIEGPGKRDHGDIDIIVADERKAALPSDSGPRTGHDEPLKKIADVLGAEHIIFHNRNHPSLGDTSANMAIPWPEDEGSDSHAIAGSPHKRRHIQVDVKIALSRRDFEWSLFRHSHGDFWQIVHRVIRPLGLTLGEEALYLRVPEIEWKDRKKAKIFLSSDRAEVLEFLGLADTNPLRTPIDKPRPDDRLDSIPADDPGSPLLGGLWERPFDTVEEMFQFVATSCWFHVALPPELKPSQREEVDWSAKHIATSSLGSDERRRREQRVVYQQWVSEYVPSLWPSVWDGTFPNHGFNGLSPYHKRQVVRNTAFEMWHGVKEQYLSRQRQWQIQELVVEQQKEIREHIKKTVLRCSDDVNWTNCTIAALKKIVFGGETKFGIWPREPLKAEEGLYNIERAVEFVSLVAKDAGDNAWEEQMFALRQLARDKKKLGGLEATEPASTTKSPTDKPLDDCP